MRMLKNNDYIGKIKEEIIEFSANTNKITNFCVIVERAVNSLDKVISNWCSDKIEEKKRDYFNPEKLFYFFFKSMKSLHYCN